MLPSVCDAEPSVTHHGRLGTRWHESDMGDEAVIVQKPGGGAAGGEAGTPGGWGGIGGGGETVE